jgi:hypothetical protein
MIPFPVPLQEPQTEHDRLYVKAYELCLRAQWTLNDPKWRDEQLEGARTYLLIRADAIKGTP